MASKAKRKLALRRMKCVSDAKLARKLEARHAEIMATPEGRFMFGREWTKEQMAAFKKEWARVDGLHFNRLPVMTNGQAH